VRQEEGTRLVSSWWRPAFTAAVACSEDDRDRGDGLWPRRATASPEDAIARAMEGDPDPDLEGGREFKSGAMDAAPDDDAQWGDEE
jgi:hypothetical protein